MADRDAWEQPLYRFACLLLRDREAARKVALETLESGVKKRPPHIDPERLIMLQFKDLRRRVFKAQTASTSTRTPRGELPADAIAVVRPVDSARIDEIVHALPEPGRTAYALLLLDALQSEWIAKLLGLGQAEFGEVVQGARLAVHHALTAKPSA